MDWKRANTDWFHEAKWGTFTHYLATWWGSGAPRYPDELPPLYTPYINGFGGVVAWDVPVSPEGRIPEVFLRQLSRIGHAA